jgi:hypothetical protein
MINGAVNATTGNPYRLYRLVKRSRLLLEEFEVVVLDKKRRLNHVCALRNVKMIAINERKLPLIATENATTVSKPIAIPAGIAIQSSNQGVAPIKNTITIA